MLYPSESLVVIAVPEEVYLAHRLDYPRRNIPDDDPVIGTSESGADRDKVAFAGKVELDAAVRVALHAPALALDDERDTAVRAVGVGVVHRVRRVGDEVVEFRVAAPVRVDKDQPGALRTIHGNGYGWLVMDADAADH